MKSRHSGKSTQSGSKALPLGIAIAVLGVGGWYVTQKTDLLRAEKAVSIEGAMVQRGPLRISVVERGNLKAADAVSLKSEIEGNASILFLVPEGTTVNEGDLVCELDVTALIDKRFQQEISVRNAEAGYVKAKQNYEIQKSQNESDIKKAEQKLVFAESDLRKFVDSEGEKKAKIEQAQEKIKLAEEEFSRANDKLGWSVKLSEKGFLTNTELEADRLSLSRANIQLEQAKRDRDLLIRFQLPRDESELSAGLDEAKRELERVKLQASARLVDFEADMRTKEAQLNLEKEKLDKHERQIAKAKIRAPRGGMVVYAVEEGGRYGNSQPIKEGTSVRERQEIITIPNAGGMIAQASLHESVLKQVQIGQPCLIKVDALGGREFHGRVKFIAVLADQNSWFANPNTRLYRTEVLIEDGTIDMRPSMSCQLEILVENIADTLYVPVQAVFRTGGDNVAFVVKGGIHEERKVVTGRFNERWVQILEGLSEGENVLLAAPAGFSPAQAPQSAIPDGALGASPGANGAPASAASGESKGGAGSAPGAGPLGAAGDSPMEGRGRNGRNGAGAADGAAAPRGEAASANDAAPSGDGERGNRPAGGGMSEEMRKRFEAMTPEEREKLREQFRNRGGRGSGGAPGGGDGTKGEESKSGG
ncbi:MAG: efflux RND transporter periplasmic adaptor subunit [Planctomycetes bacterium]|nr:efflux RND transporter periplasmic adaptor subunit [Planctomycetota bacterium]